MFDISLFLPLWRLLGSVLRRSHVATFSICIFFSFCALLDTHLRLYFARPHRQAHTMPLTQIELSRRFLFDRFGSRLYCYEAIFKTKFRLRTSPPCTPSYLAFLFDFSIRVCPFYLLCFWSLLCCADQRF
jgi:hypothetical protein